MQNEQLISRISPEALGTLLAGAPCLEDLRTSRSSLAPDQLRPLTLHRSAALKFAR